MRYSLLLVLFITTGLSAQNMLTAEDAVKIGLKNNFSINIARNNAEIAGNNETMGTAGFLPTLEATGGYQYSRSEQETNSPFSFGNSDTKSLNAQVTLNWTLFDGFKMFADNIRYKQLSKLGEYQARNQIENTVVAVLNAYFNVVQQEQLLEVARKNAEISESRFEKAKVRNEIGGASSTDLLNSRVSLNNDLSQLMNQELAVEIAKKDLNLLLARDAALEFIVEKKINIPNFNLSLEDITAAALERNSRLIAARTSLKVAEQNESLSRSAYYPRLWLGAGYIYSDRRIESGNPNFSDEIKTKSTDYNIGLNLSINLFNGFRDDVGIQNAVINRKNSELELLSISQDVQGSVREKYSTFLKKMEIVRLERKNIEAAEQNMDLQKDLYETGAGGSLDFRDAQLNLLRARTQLITASYQARITLLEIEQLIGDIKIEH